MMNEFDESSRKGARQTNWTLYFVQGAIQAKPGSVWLCVGLALAGAFFLFCRPSFVIDFLLGMDGIRKMEAQLRRPEIYTPTALRLATYCQSDQKFFPEYLSPDWLPVELQRVGRPEDASVSTNMAAVFFGGGFYHFGYRLELNQAASTSMTNVWELYQFAEDSPTGRLLLRVRIPRTQHVSEDELQTLVLGSFDDKLKHGDFGAFRSKVLFQLRFGKTRDAVQTCRDWIQRQPDYWLPQFTYAHVRCRAGEYDKAAGDYTAWTRAHKNFAHCIYLALFQLREGRTNDAMNGVRWALGLPFVEPLGTEGNKFYLGENGALIAYMNEDYDLCTAVCDRMLADSRQEDWWRRKILRIKAAVTFLQGRRASALDLLREAESLNRGDPFSGPDMMKADARLRNLIVSNDMAAIKDIRGWVDEPDSWFTPFETDDTGIHGMRVPTPYPPSWKTDKIHPAQVQESAESAPMPKGAQ